MAACSMLRLCPVLRCVDEPTRQQANTPTRRHATDTSEGGGGSHQRGELKKDRGLFFPRVAGDEGRKVLLIVGSRPDIGGFAKDRALRDCSRHVVASTPGRRGVVAPGCSPWAHSRRSG